MDGLLKLLFPDSSMVISDVDLEWAARIALEVRRRVKEQQRKIVPGEFRQTNFGYRIGEGIETFVAPAEIRSDRTIGPEPLSVGQVWAIGLGGVSEHPGLYRISVMAERGPGSMRMLNTGVAPELRESANLAFAMLQGHWRALIGPDRDPGEKELKVQVETMDPARTGVGLSIPILMAMSSALLDRPLRPGMAIAGSTTIAGVIEPITRVVDICELAAERGAAELLLPIGAKRDLADLSDEVASSFGAKLYVSAEDALRKALSE
jgi:ATP-dependent Lon protease